MAEPELGASFAIHGGGSDLVFPHHENEIAQSEAAGRPFARIWMHNGMIETDAAKMSKSEGNIFQLSEALDRYGREAVVAYLISGHYRQPLAFGRSRWSRPWRRSSGCGTSFGSTRSARGSPGRSRRQQQRGGSVETSPDSPTARLAAFREALADDFNTPRAMAEVFELVGEANRGEVPGRGRRRCARCSSWSGSSRWPSRRRARPTPRRRRCWPSGRRRGRRRTSSGPMRFGIELAELGWEVRDSADGPRLVPKA